MMHKWTFEHCVTQCVRLCVWRDYIVYSLNMIPTPPTSSGDILHLSLCYWLAWFHLQSLLWRAPSLRSGKPASDTEITEMGLLTKRTPTVDSQCQSTINDRHSRTLNIPYITSCCLIVRVPQMHSDLSISEQRHAYSFLFITELGANSLIYRANFPLFDSLIWYTPIEPFFQTPSIVYGFFFHHGRETKRRPALPPAWDALLISMQ